MAQRKGSKSGSSSKRKTSPSRKRSTAKKKTSGINIEKYIGIVLLSVLLTLLASQFRYRITNTVYQYDCIEPKAGDYPAQLVHNAINIHHQIRENPNKKDELMEYLADRVIWFRRSRTETPKSRIRTFSAYDDFCYAEYPIYSDRDAMNNNYEMNFIGIHRYRLIDSLYSQVEKYYCEIQSGKISKLYSVPINNLEKDSYRRVNSLYQYFYAYIFGGSLLFFLVVNYVTTLPETLIRGVIDLVKRFIPGL